MDINLTRRQMVIIAAGVLSLIIIVVVLLFINSSGKSTDEFVPEIYDAGNINSQATTKQAEVVNEESALAMAVARNFAARYLSFSNENWGNNIAALESQMTEGMIQSAQQDLIGLQNKYPDDEFYGVSAKVLSQNIISASPSMRSVAGEVSGDYSLLLSVQLQKTIGSVEQIDYTEYQIDLVSSGDTWLIDNLSLRE